MRTCEVDSAQLIDAATGQVKNGDVVTKAIDVEFIRVETIWKAAPGSEIRRWSGDKEQECVGS
jgi:hypothetical protein